MIIRSRIIADQLTVVVFQEMFDTSANFQANKIVFDSSSIALIG